MYSPSRTKSRSRSFAPLIKKSLAVLLLIGVSVIGYNYLLVSPTIEEIIKSELVFDESITADEKERITNTASQQLVKLDGSVQVGSDMNDDLTNVGDKNTLDVYVPVTTFNSVRQSVTSVELSELATIAVPSDLDPIIQRSLSQHLNTSADKLVQLENGMADLADEAVAIVSITQLDKSMKLLTFNDIYYLDNLAAGGIFRTVTFSTPLDTFSLQAPTEKDDIYKVNMTGVTALTRIMQRKLTQVGGDPLYFSAKIGDFLADADLTHVSNEVSFKPDCGYSDTLFCSPPEFIKTLQASGVDLVELTGNHNNDLGSQFNTETIELYKSLGWGTVGGGLNAADAALPYVSDTKDSKVSFLAYNYPDSPNGGAIAGLDKAGANSFDFARIETEIAAAKQAADFIIVSVQYWECYAYPDGYIEYPTCDVPIGDQEEVFKKLVDFGADMVVGTSAHQPQTYELHNGVPIYYGLGNLFFDQTQWPGTERGIVLTHYFSAGKLLQTKLTPTVFDSDLQTRVASAEEAQYLLSRLQSAR